MDKENELMILRYIQELESKINQLRADVRGLTAERDGWKRAYEMSLDIRRASARKSSGQQ